MGKDIKGKNGNSMKSLKEDPKKSIEKTSIQKELVFSSRVLLGQIGLFSGVKPPEKKLTELEHARLLCKLNKEKEN